MTSTPLRRGAVLLLVDAEGRLLLKLRDDAPIWCLPGGFAEGAETPLQNVCREVEEELNLKLVPERLTQVASYKFYQPYNSSHISATLFYLPYAGEAYSLGHEGTQLQFFAPAELPLNMFANQRDLALRATAQRYQPFVDALDLATDRTLDLLPTLAPEQLTGLADWRIHPRVAGKRALGKLKFDC